MKLNTLFTAHAIVSIAYGVLGLLLTGTITNLLWNNPPGSEAFIMGRGWSASLLALGVLAWGARIISDIKVRRLLATGFFVYFVISALVWLLDQIARGWLLLGGVTFILLLLFMLGYGYFLVIKPESNRRVMI